MTHAVENPIPNVAGPAPASDLASALGLDKSGKTAEAAAAYQEVIERSRASGSNAVESEALRRLAVIQHHQGELLLAIDLCQKSFEVATAADDQILAAEALNTLAGITFETGEIERARSLFAQAQDLGSDSPSLWGRIEQNLGILANIQGDWGLAREHYIKSLAAFERAGDERGSAIAFHNLGIISTDLKSWDDADRYYERSHAIASRLGERRLQGLGRLNQASSLVQRERYGDALVMAEEALQVFDEIGSPMDKAEGYRVIGAVYRQTGRPLLAEARLATAIKLSRDTGSVLGEAESVRELALLYRALGRNKETLDLLNQAHLLFGRLDARRDMIDVDAKVEHLEDTFGAVVRDWGQSIESADSYTFGHCERVAAYASVVAAGLHLDGLTQKTIRFGAYLHDLGKVRVPHEILNKPGRLTPEEFEVIKQHPLWGLDMLEGVEFPWDIKPIIRSHHERYEGGGYPDGLAGAALPVNAMIICVADVWDALTTTRSYRPAMTTKHAMEQMQESRGWWRKDVFAAFERAVPSMTARQVR